MRWLIVGAGSIGLKHLAVLKGLGEHDLACVEPDPERRKEAWRFTGKQHAYASIEDADAFQVGLVCTPTHRHVDDALAVLGYGANVIIEKPVAHEMTRGPELLKAASNSLAIVACPMRFHLGISQLREQVHKGELGHPRFAQSWYFQAMHEWRPGRDMHTVYSAHKDQGGGLFYDRIHELDTLRWILGEPDAVSATIGNSGTYPGLAVEDQAFGLLSIPSPTGTVMATVDLDATQPGYFCGMRIVGTKNIASVDTAPIVNGQAQMQGWDQAMIDQSKHWLACLHGDAEPCQDILSAYRVLQTAVALYVSAESAQWCKLDFQQAKAAA